MLLKCIFWYLLCLSFSLHSFIFSLLYESIAAHWAQHSKDILLEELGTLGSYITSFWPFCHHFIIAYFNTLKGTLAA